MAMVRSALQQQPEDKSTQVNKISAPLDEANLINTNAAYQTKWRKANTELNRLRAKEGMRKIRAQRDNANT